MPIYPGLRRLLAKSSPAVSAISLVEVLGYHRLTPASLAALQAAFAAARVLPIDAAVVAGAVRLRQLRKMSLGDAIIAATALEQHEPLWTRNVLDFRSVPGLTVFDPLANGDPP